MVTARERTGVLVLRAWVEPGDPVRVRARITQSLEIETPGQVVVTTVGIDVICAVVQRWLETLQDHASQP
jgi:hypothetical protein